ncbi:hemolysin family protein [Sarcina ventriculi]|uniref:hemolysin family protein n=1 Tax=Sarcina ventriculi TaxID=1267 RepID=UPI0018ABA055|nr:hemolysin family protein [Sarcina ventriculi]
MNSSFKANSLIFQFILILILTLINAFFSASEMAIVSLNKNKIKVLAEEGNKNAILIERLLQEPTKFLSTVQVGITLASFFSSASAATGISNVFGNSLETLNIPYAHEISLIVVTIILSYITLVFGELLPKRLALQNSQKIAMYAVKPIMLISKITIPFVKLLSISTNFLIRLFNVNSKNLEEKVSKEEIKSLVDVGQEHGVINETEKDMINSIFEFDDKLAKEVMTPRTNVYMINIDDCANTYLNSLLNEKYSRIPIFQENIDNIIGILYMKDFLCEAYKVGFDNVNLRNILHTPYFVPEMKNIDELFKELQISRKHMAILIDEYGGFSGIVTIEDLIEEVMGDIGDEFDDEEILLKNISKNTFLASGLISINELNEKLHINLDSESDDYDTLGGFIIKLIGYIPKKDDDCIVNYKNIIFKIKEVNKKRIVKVEITINNSLEDK